MEYASDAVYNEMTPAQRRAHIAELYRGAMNAYNRGYLDSARRGTTQGSAFLWVSVYGKTKVAKAFRRVVKQNARVIQNYRGTPFAWYFGSQTDVGKWDALNAMCKYLTANGVDAYTCDEWD